MPSRKTFEEIKLNILNPALTSHFEVEIQPPEKVVNFLNDSSFSYPLNAQKINLMCCECSLPGSSLATVEINNDYTGSTERHAYRRLYDDRMDFTFYVDSQYYAPIVLFEGWIKYISGESIAIDETTRGVGVKDPNYFYKVRWPKSYMTNSVRIVKFERNYANTIQYEFINAYPISIASMPVSYESSNLLKCTVSMTYLRYVYTNLKINPTTNIIETPVDQSVYNNFINPEFNIGGVPDITANLSGNTVR